VLSSSVLSSGGVMLRSDERSSSRTLFPADAEDSASSGTGWLTACRPFCGIAKFGALCLIQTSTFRPSLLSGIISEESASLYESSWFFRSSLRLDNALWALLDFRFLETLA
jgi:hypothetical protein